MPLTPTQRAEEARGRARALAGRLHGLDQAGEGRHDEAFCRSLLRALAAERLLEHLVPVAYGGAAPILEVSAVAAIREELAYGSGLLDLLFVMQGLGSFPIVLAGTEEQKRRHLPPVAEGRAVAAFAVTEPEAGSDVSAIRTAARRASGGWTLEGTKTFISNAPFADVMTVIAQADPGKGRAGLAAFIVDRDARGIEREPIQTLAPHPLGTLEFRDCHLPAESLLGKVGDGFGIAMATLARFRATVGAAAVGFARRALAEAVRFAKERVAFGRPISEFEGIQFKLAEMATRLDAAQLLVERAAATIDRHSRASQEGEMPGSGSGAGGPQARQSEGAGSHEVGADGRAGGDSPSAIRSRGTEGTPAEPPRAAGTAEAGSPLSDGERPAGTEQAGSQPWSGGPNLFPLSPLGEDPSREASMAKLFATEAAQEIVDEAVQIHGGRGLVSGSVVEALYREVRALRIYEGTSEIQRTIIGRSLLGR